MNDYSKWDNIKDSDDEAEEVERPKSDTLEEEKQETLRVVQERVDRWLRNQILQLEVQQQSRPKTSQYQNAYGQPPELSELKKEDIAYRRVTKEERKVVAMLVAISHFEEGTTNLDRHPQMLELVRHHRFLEDDPGTLELLCRVHNTAMRKMRDGDHDEGALRTLDNPEDQRMRNMLMCGINTLAAPKKCKCPGGLLELITQICTPTTEEGRERRKKWQTKEYAKDAVFDSLFPDLRQFGEDDNDSGWTDIIVFGAVFVMLILIALVLMYGGMLNSKVKTTTQLLTTTLAPFIAPEAAAASAASAVEGRENEL